MYFHCEGSGLHGSSLFERAILASIAPGQIEGFPERLIQLAASTDTTLSLRDARTELPKAVACLGVNSLIVPDLVAAAVARAETASELEFMRAEHLETSQPQVVPI